MSQSVLAFLVLTLLSGFIALSGIAPDVVEGLARAGVFGFGTLFLCAGALTRWSGPSVHLPG